MVSLTQIKTHKLQNTELIFVCAEQISHDNMSVWTVEQHVRRRIRQGRAEPIYSLTAFITVHLDAVTMVVVGYHAGWFSVQFLRHVTSGKPLPAS